jgi:dTDP-glucose pyrophosphorylase
MMNYKSRIVKDDQTIRQALALINELTEGSLTLFVIDNSGEMVGTLTDGDIRRGLLNDVALSQPVKDIMNKNFKFFKANEFDVLQVQRLKNEKKNLIPLLDENHKIVQVVDLSERKSFLPMEALIMAGGEGTRLRPLTLSTPKPLLRVGQKPIIEHNIDRLINFGVENFYISIRYLGEQIENYFQDGNNKNVHINYIKETEPLGTIGALSLVKEIVYEHVLVMNADLLTNLDYEDMFATMLEEDADMIVATSAYEVKVPYGIIETNGKAITALKEKPVYTYFSNAGIYIIRKNALKYLPYNKHINATDLMDALIADGKKVVNYPILGYWLDIGGHEAFNKAQEDIRHLEL